MVFNIVVYLLFDKVQGFFTMGRINDNYPGLIGNISHIFQAFFKHNTRQFLLDTIGKVCFE